MSHLRHLYSDQVLFKDPVHEIRGLVELEDYFTAMCGDLTDCRFEYLDEVVTDHAAYVKWVMHFKHPRLGNRLISVRGVSHLRISDKIDYHEDFYDMGAMLYEQLPLLGSVTALAAPACAWRADSMQTGKQKNNLDNRSEQRAGSQFSAATG